MSGPIQSNSRYQYAVPLDSTMPIPEEEFQRFVPKPAKTYPFELDTFQKQAIIHIEKGENVFVAAHTSAGKTVVAEYAIALAFAHKTRVIYTSPIKALSNQKFRDLRLEFKEVGIITGDVQLNPEAPCLVMTTEILLQMLYASSESINHLEFVIFDECHYVNDSKRGHVWEEVFILLPSSVKLVLLSATVPNVIEFSDWLGRTRQKKIHVISTTKRPVPLKHYLYLGRDGKTQNLQLLILDGDGPIIKSNHEVAEDIMKQRKAKYGFIKRNAQTERNIYLNLIRHLQKNDKLPVICFTLSRKKCDQNLAMLLSIKEENASLTTKREAYHIKKFVCKHLSSLKSKDHELEQVKRVSTMLVRGFGVHHSGILPILKEITEILFSSGMVKVLFATETFAMGVNMPARTVVFDSLNKHDGYQTRYLKPAEYIQMAGRAGRRGKDTEGTVIILCKYEVPSLMELNMVMKGSAQCLESQFRLTYHMILNMLKSQASSIEQFLTSSYREHSKVLSSSSLETTIQDLCEKIDELPQLCCQHCAHDIDLWHTSFEDFKYFKKPLMPTIIMRACDKKLLTAGRLMIVEDEHQIFRLAALLRSVKSGNAVSELMVLCADERKPGSGVVLTITVQEVCCLLNKQIKNMDANSIVQENESSKSFSNKQKLATEAAIQKMDAMNIPKNQGLLQFAVGNFISHEKLGKWDPDTIFVMQDYGLRLMRLAAPEYNCLRCDNFMEHYQVFVKKARIEEKITQLNYKRSNESLELLPEYKQRILVLQEFQFLDQHLVLLPKGQIASCLSESELIITEIVFENLLGNLSDEAIPAVLACFIFDSKKDDAEMDMKFIVEITELEEIMKKIVEICIRFGKKEKELSVEESETHYLEQLNFEPVRSVYEWAKGKSFSEIMEFTNLQEGTMVRCIQRVDELMKNIRIASRNLDLVDFQAKLERSSRLIRRDIVFMPSLYTSQEMVGVYDQEKPPSQSQPEQMAAEDDQDDDDGNEIFFNYNFNVNEGDEESGGKNLLNNSEEPEQFDSNFI